MSFISDIEAVGMKVEDFLKAVVTGAGTLQAVWGKLSGPTLAVCAAIFSDVLKSALAAESAASDASTGNFLGAVTLSETTISLIQTLVTDAKKGETQIVADFKALGITI